MGKLTNSNKLDKFEQYKRFFFPFFPKANMKQISRALKDLYVSIKNNLNQIEFNKNFLIPYGVFRLILIVKLKPFT